MDLRIGVSPEEFPKVAKEMGFGFSLRRGRVDWDRIDTLDVDRLIQERDLMRLHENLNNIVNYSLNNEYDVKILDPNFVKLFRLAQLAVDYLMYSEQHLYNNVELLQHELSLSVKEIERLKRECKKKDDDLKNMKKQIRERERRIPETHAHHQHQQLNSDGSGVSRCSLCGKMFMSDMYLEAHHTRRHAGVPFAVPTATPSSRDIEQLQAEVKRLKELLTRTEDKENIPQNVIIQQSDEKSDEKKEWEEEYRRKMKEWEQKYEEELEALRQMFITEVKEPRQELLDLVTRKDQEISQLREELSQQVSQEPSEGLWQEKLSTLQSEYNTAIEELREQLHHTQEENKQKVLSKVEYEDHIQELMSRLAAQEEQIRQLSELNAKTLLQRPTTPRTQRVTPTKEYESPASDEPDVNGFVKTDASLKYQRRSPKEFLVETSGDGKKRTGQLTTKERRHLSQEIISVESDRVSERDRSPFPERRKTKEFVISSLPNEGSSVRKTANPPQRQMSIAPVTIREEESTSIQQDSSSVTSSSSSEQPTQVHIDTRKAQVTPLKSKVLRAELSNQWHIGDNEGSPAHHRGTPEKTSYGKVQMFPEQSESEDVSEEMSSAEVGSDSPQDKTNSLRSIDSLQTALAKNPHIMSELKLDVELVLERRLKELGVDPEWEGIPSGTFSKKMGTLKHHENITAKRLKSYFRVRQELLEVLDNQMSADKPEDKPPAQRKTPTLNKIVSSVRERARNVFKHSRTGKRHPSSGTSITTTKEPVRPTSGSRSDKKTQQRSKELPRPELKATFAEGSAGRQMTRAKMVTSTPTKKVTASPAKSTPVRGAMNPEPASPETETSTSFEDEEARIPIQRPPAPTPRKASMGFTEVVLESPAGSKSSLKSAASSSSQAKKRVLFAEHDDVKHITERGDTHRSTLPRSETTSTLSRRLSVSDELPTGSGLLLDKPLAARLEQDSDSDWEDLSTETRTDTAGTFGSNNQINLSTKQSDKIALISKSIEHQLNLTRSKPPGGVEAMFGGTAAPVPVPVPVPKPRSQLTSTAPLSEWDLEDFDD